MTLTNPTPNQPSRTLGGRLPLATANADRRITIEQCYCGYPTCRDYWLVGIGKFVQGSGFTRDEAERIADLLNGEAA